MLSVPPRSRRSASAPGTGQPTGLFTANGGTVGVTAASATAVTTDEVISLIYALKAPYRKNAKFLMNDATVSALRKLKDSNGQYLWQPSLQAGQPDRLLGYEIYTSPYAPTLAAGALSIAFGDFQSYWIADRTGQDCSASERAVFHQWSGRLCRYRARGRQDHSAGGHPASEDEGSLMRGGGGDGRTAYQSESQHDPGSRGGLSCSFRATSPPLFHTRRATSTSRRERIKTRPMRRPRNRLLSCWHPTSMKAGMAARAASSRIAQEQHSRCGKPSTCCFGWIGGGRYELWENERLCRHCKNKTG